MRKVTRMTDLPAEARIRLELQLEKNHPAKTRKKKTNKIQSKAKIETLAKSYYQLDFNKDDYENYLKNKFN